MNEDFNGVNIVSSPPQDSELFILSSLDDREIFLVFCMYLFWNLYVVTKELRLRF